VIVRLRDGTAVGEGHAVLARDWTEDDEGENEVGLWYGAVVLENPTEALQDRLHSEGQVWLRDWIGSGSRLPELRLAIRISCRTTSHLHLLLLSGPPLEHSWQVVVAS